MAGPAYVDAFRRIVVQPDNITISADAVDDTLTLVAGAGISLVANATSDQITIVNTNSAQFSLGVAGDDSSIKIITSGETIKFTGAQNITVTTDAEGAITITGPNLSSYLTAESDPVFSASPAAGITNTNISNWNTAYSWGDHSTAGYLTSVPPSASAYSFNVAADDSSQKIVSNGETIKFIGSNGITTTSNSEGDITIVGPNLSAYATQNYVNSQGFLTQQYSFNVAGDDSTLRQISNGETLRFAGGTGITVSSDTEGKITITASGSPTFSNVTVTGQVVEQFQTYTTAISGTPTITFDCTNGNIWRIAPSGGPGSAWTAAFTNVATTTNYTANITQIITQGATAFLPSAVTINGTSVTITWQGGTPPTGNANKTDIVSYSVLQTGASTYVVFGQLVTFG